MEYETPLQALGLPASLEIALPFVILAGQYN
jgi:hypothetical protein